MNAYDKAIEYISRGMKTEAQTFEYLKEKGFDEPQIKEAILLLKEKRYIDDIEYSARVFEIQYERGRGRLWIEQYLLKNRGVKRADITEGYALFLESRDKSPIDEDEKAFEIAEKTLDKKELDDKMQAKIIRKLASRGFRSSSAYRALDRLKRARHESE